MAKQKITIYHLYPDQMNLYGDIGNIKALVKRCEWRGIEADVLNVYAGSKVNFMDADILFMGGGQDRGQKIIAEDLQKIGPQIKNEIDKGLVALLICGGFQLFGKYFKTKEGTKIPGIGVFNAHTIAGDSRLIGNVTVDISNTSTRWQFDQNLPKYESPHVNLVGFENHSGRTILEQGADPLGYVIHGFGNEGDGGTEGGVYKNAYGTYLHGSLLPKNPWFTDHLIMRALYRRYGNVTKLEELDDSVEIEAHNAALKRAETAKTLSI